MEAESSDHSTESTNVVSKNEHPEVVSNKEPHAKASDNAEPLAQTASSNDVGGDKHDNASSLETPVPITSLKERSSDLPHAIPPQDPEKNLQNGGFGASAFARFTNGLGLRIPSMVSEEGAQAQSSATTSTQVGGVFESLAKGFVDSSRSAVKAVQVKARHAVSQNKRRYQEGGFDLDMAYITENIIAMGFPAGDISSGLFGFFEGFYRNHMEEVINFLETQHKGKYKVYNLCSERLYDASRFEGKLASFPFEDHNCPPLQLVTSFCQSAYSWLKEDIENVVVVHCKAGMGRTGLMICSLLLYLKFFPTAEEAIDYFNQKRCVDGKALVLPSQIRYVKYFERLLTYFNGENQPGRRCMLRGFRLLKCPYWIRPSITISNHSGVLFSTKKHPKTKDLMPEDFWIKSPKKGIVVFALPGEPGLTEVAGDFKIHFQDRQGDFYCWLNTTMTENRKTLDASDLDGFDKRKLPSPGFQVEVVMVDYDGTLPAKSKPDSAGQGSNTSASSGYVPPQSGGVAASSKQRKASENDDDVFSDSDEERNEASKNRKREAASEVAHQDHKSNIMAEQMSTITHGTEQMSLRSQEPPQGNATKEANTGGVSDIKSIAADASVFTFGDEEDFESD